MANNFMSEAPEMPVDGNESTGSLLQKSHSMDLRRSLFR